MRHNMSIDKMGTTLKLESGIRCRVFTEKALFDIQNLWNKTNSQRSALYHTLILKKGGGALWLNGNQKK